MDGPSSIGRVAERCGRELIGSRPHAPVVAGISGGVEDANGTLGERLAAPVRRVMALCPRDDRTQVRRVFEGVTADRLRTAIGRACVAAGVPGFSPHDLRHRRISLTHLTGVPWARIGEHVGQRDLAVTANTYTHVLVDERELDYATLLE